MDKDRNLSPQEARRLEEFEARISRMASEGWKMKDLSFGLTAANLLAIPAALIPALAVFIPYYRIYGTFCPLSYGLNLFTVLLALIGASLLLSALHELIHGISWAIFAPGHFKAVSFGFMLKSLNPYCFCSEPLKKWQYILGALMPTVILGFIPGIIALETGSLIWLFISVLMILGGGGDILLVLRLLFYRSSAGCSLYADHPVKCGAVVFEK